MATAARVERRLTAIMVADVVGYSRHIERDEARALAAIRALRSEILEPLLDHHRGRVVKLMGDGLIVEFGSVVDAVACAVAVQQRIAGDQVVVSTDSRLLLRIGIAVGDVVVEGEDLLGDGVNIAARLEALAEPGGICISDAAYGQLAGKIDAPFEDAGERTLKNITQPVRIWRWAGSQGAVSAGAILPLPDRPSVAVLPFDNLSGQPEETYFSDGITEDIITGLARFRSLFVVARNSSFAFRGKAIGLAEIGRQLGVAYLLEGSVRRAGDRVRITAQLIDASTGAHLWADRYDRGVDDIFAVQDEVAQMIVSILVGRIEAAKLQQSVRRPTHSLAAYDFVLRGLMHLSDYAPDANEKALRMFERAVELDPEYAVAHAYCGMAAVFLNRQTTAGLLDAKVLASSLEQGLIGIKLDPQDSRCHRALVIIRLFRREYDLAEHHARQAVSSNPNDADDIALMGLVLTLRGHAEDAPAWIEKAKRLNPFHPPYYDAASGRMLYAMRRYAESVQAYMRIPGLNSFLRAQLAACFGQLGEAEKARPHVEALLREQPNLTAADYIQRDFAFEHAEDREHLREGLIKAGLPP
jgi:TolB-like protein/class 3 adenylate cyclase